MFYSLPLCPANTAIITKGISDDGGNKLYFDSLIFAYTDEGLELSQAWDMASFMPGNNKKEYVEYDGAAGGDSDNDSGSNADKSAKTGDDTNLALLFALLGLSAAGLVGTGVYGRRKVDSHMK